MLLILQERQNLWGTQSLRPPFITIYTVFSSESSLIVFMMTIISLLLLASLLPHLIFTGKTDYKTAHYSDFLRTFNLYLLKKLTWHSLSAHVKMGIVNGTEAKPHSRPYMVSVQSNKEHICGGFLISDEFVLTAAHCWNGWGIFV